MTEEQSRIVNLIDSRIKHCHTFWQHCNSIWFLTQNWNRLNQEWNKYRNIQINFKPSLWKLLTVKWSAFTINANTGACRGGHVGTLAPGGKIRMNWQKKKLSNLKIYLHRRQIAILKLQSCPSFPETSARPSTNK